jgi:hypothetical protein
MKKLNGLWFYDPKIPFGHQSQRVARSFWLFQVIEAKIFPRSQPAPCSGYFGAGGQKAGLVKKKPECLV